MCLTVLPSANDYVIASTGTNGDCSDGGATAPSVQVIGRVLSTNGGAGTYSVLVSAGNSLAGPLLASVSLARLIRSLLLEALRSRPLDHGHLVFLQVGLPLPMVLGVRRKQRMIIRQTARLMRS